MRKTDGSNAIAYAEGVRQYRRMKPFFRKSGAFFLLIASALFLFGLINVYFPGAGFLLFLVGLPTLPIALVTITTIWLIRGIKMARSEVDRSKAIVYVCASPVMCLLVVLTASLLIFLGGFVGDLARLAVNQRQYAAIISKARVERRAEWYAEDTNGVTYSVDVGPPVRVAFEPAGMLDNWSAIVFDPSGKMMMANGFNSKTGEFQTPEPITKLFGGDLVSCRRLWGDYLTCSFT
ncbi:hypothetical protein SAMN06272759_108152 [Novosphingobium sp. B1]|nr:hypothetical protein SAMN06272759_108152 [Novosphingobium sp. B1]